MKCSTIFAGAIAASAASARALYPRALDTFQLQTTSSDSRFDGLYVEAYHTGAGEGDAVLSTAAAGANFFFSNTSVDSTVYGYNGVTNNVSIAGLELGEPVSEYNSWAAVTINGGEGTDGMTYNDTYGLAGSSYYEFAGWLACYWAHDGAPQLFNLAYDADTLTLPESCAVVNLFKA